ncbi:MAG TPA: GNAT family N-acetyltransferase [Negativicutes bacterium]|nr:GNAT family N-acetyltransferase [Negativicutes bacterium]
MPQAAGGFIFSRDKSLLQLDRVCELIAQTYWAKDRARDKIQTSIENSLCFGVYKDGFQVGFARAVTDYVSIYWVSDVIIDEAYRGQGLGKGLVELITTTDELQGMRGILRTRDAHGLYEQFGFVKDDKFMLKSV